MTFAQLNISQPILKALEQEGYQTPTPIQQQAIPILLKGKDLLGIAQTGTGKTAAFAIPILDILSTHKKQEGKRKIKALIVTPTRELAIQIGESFNAYGKFTGLKNTVIFGGVGQGKQTEMLNKGVDILVATPGRLLDLMNQGFISLKDLDFVVLDEADQMLDMGFIHDVKKIVAALPAKRQSLFFSATMPSTIVDLSKKILGAYEKVSIKPEQATAEKVEQAVYFVSKKDKAQLLTQIIKTQKPEAALVFSRTKHGANKIVKILESAHINAAAIHGNKSQTARQKALGDFKNGKLQILVATDIAARGIDVDNLSLVVNYDLPNVPETYVHRIGRTGRADASGVALSFCDGEERAFLKDIQKLIGLKVPVIENHDFVDDGTIPISTKENKPSRNFARKNDRTPKSSDNQNSTYSAKNKNTSFNSRKTENETTKVSTHPSASSNFKVKSKSYWAKKKSN